MRTKTLALDVRADEDQDRRQIAAKKTSAALVDSKEIILAVPDELTHWQVPEEHEGLDAGPRAGQRPHGGGGFEEELSLTDSFDDGKQKFNDVTMSARMSAGASVRRESVTGQRHEGSSKPEERSLQMANATELPVSASSNAELPFEPG